MSSLRLPFLNELPSISPLWRLLWPHLKRYPWLLGAAVLTTLIHVLVARLLPFSIGWFIDKGILAKDVHQMLLFAVITAILAIVNSLAQSGYWFFFGVLGAKVVKDLRYETKKRLLDLPLNFFHENPSGTIVTRLTHDIGRIQELSSDGVIVIVIQALTVMGILGSLLWIHWVLTLWSLLVMIFFVGFGLKVIGQVRQCQTESKSALSQLAQMVSQYFASVKFLQASGYLNVAGQSVQTLSENYTHRQLKVVKTSALLHPVMNLSTAALLGGALMAYGFWLNSQIPLGLFVTFLLQANDLIHPMRDILEKYQSFQDAITSAQRLLPFREHPTESELLRRMPIQPGSCQKSNSVICEFQDVWFRYKPDLPWVLKNIHGQVQAGDKIALIGRTGSGKTTLIHLLGGFYQPEKGWICFKQKPLQSWILREIRQKVGYVWQDTLIYQGTWWDNLTFGNPQARQRLEQLLQETGLWDDFHQKGWNLDSWIYERGQNLSQGEKQLINFLRIMAQPYELLILDEATSHLDPLTEAMLKKLWWHWSQHHAAIIIAHRWETLRHVNRIWVLDQGNLHVLPPENLNLNDLRTYLEEKPQSPEASHPSGF